MRVTRGLLASLGASGCMAAAGACVLLALSTAIGVHGWPGLDGGATGAQTISARTVAAHRAPRQWLGGPGGPTARAAARHVLAATEAAPSDLPPTTATASAPSAPQPAATVVQPAPAAIAPAASAAPGAPAAKSTPAGDVVRGAGDTAGSVAAPASPAAAQTITGATGAAGDAVDKVAHTVTP